MSDKANQGEVSFEVLHDRFEQSHRLVLIESVIAQMRTIVYHGDLVSGNGRRLQRPSRYFMLHVKILTLNRTIACRNPTGIPPAGERLEGFEAVRVDLQ